MRINTNVAAIIANNSLQKAEDRLNQSIRRLSSGYKINSSADDPAGCAISEKLRLQLKGLSQSDNNAADGVSVINTAEGAISEIQSMISRMKELTVQAANGTNSESERQAIQDEIDNINKEINRISNDTEFNSQALINGNLSRRVYSNIEGINQLECSDGFVAGNYGITVTADARQAIMTGADTISMGAGDKITKEQAGDIDINGYTVSISEGDTLDDIISKLVDAADLIGGKAFVTDETAQNDTKANGSVYAGYVPNTTYEGGRLMIMTNQYGSEQSLTVKCSNTELAGLLGLNNDVTTDDGYVVNGSDVQAEFTKDADGKRVGFEDSAVMSTSGTRVTIKDVNNKTFVTDVTGTSAGTKFDDVNKSNSKSQAISADTKDVVQEVTDVGTMSIHIGSNEYQVIKLDIPALNTYTLGTDTINVMTGMSAGVAISTVDNALSIASAARSKLGAYSNRFEHTISNLSISSENLTSSLSKMIDTDMSEEMTEYTSMNVLSQAATSILSQANQRPANVLQLLQ